MQTVVSNSLNLQQIRDAFKDQAEFINVLTDPKSTDWKLSHMGANVGQISILKRELSNNAPYDLARVNFAPSELPDRKTRIIVQPISHNLNISAEHYENANEFLNTAQILLNLDTKLTMRSVLDVLQVNYAPKPKDLPELRDVKFSDPNSPLIVLYGAGGRMTGFIGDIKLTTISLNGQSKIKPNNPLESAMINGIHGDTINGF